MICTSCNSDTKYQVVGHGASTWIGSWNCSWSSSSLGAPLMPHLGWSEGCILRMDSGESGRVQKPFSIMYRKFATISCKPARFEAELVPGEL